MSKKMQLKIVNKTGIGNDTKVIVMDNDKEIGQLLCVRSINFDPISYDNLIVANLECYIRNIDLIALPKKDTFPVLHHIHNKLEMERLGLGRIN